MSTYYVSGVWFENDAISHVAVHEVRDGCVGKATRLSLEQLATGMEYHQFFTAVWNYYKGAWTPGTALQVFKENGQPVIQCSTDGRQRIDLGNLLQMGQFVN